MIDSKFTARTFGKKFALPVSVNIELAKLA